MEIWKFNEIMNSIGSYRGAWPWYQPPLINVISESCSLLNKTCSITNSAPRVMQTMRTWLGKDTSNFSQTVLAFKSREKQAVNKKMKTARARFSISRVQGSIRGRLRIRFREVRAWLGRDWEFHNIQVLCLFLVSFLGWFRVFGACFERGSDVDLGVQARFERGSGFREYEGPYLRTLGIQFWLISPPEGSSNIV